MILIEGHRKRRVCRKNKLGVPLSPVPVMVRQKVRKGRRHNKNVSLYASDVNGSGYGSLVYSHCLEMGGSEGEVGEGTHSYSGLETRTVRG